MDESVQTVSIDVSIQGMSCEGCVRRVRLGKARLEFYPHVVTAETLRGTIAALGYTIPGPPKRRNLFGRFLDRMIETNEKTFGNERLDCCTMKKR